MKRFFTKKKIIWGSIILLVVLLIGFRIFKPKDTSNILTEQVAKKDLQQTVLATGQVTSNVDLDLNFRGSGPVSKINVKVGDKVKEGQILATLDQKDELASLTSARGALASAQASLEKVLSGSSTEEVEVAQVALDNAIRQHTILVNNAWSTLLNSTLEAKSSSTLNTATATVIGTYTGTEEGYFNITLESAPSIGDIDYKVYGLGHEEGRVKRGVNLYIGQGLYINFSTTGTLLQDPNWRIDVPNTLAPDYLTNYNAYQTALKNKEAAIATAQANLDLAKAQATPADIKAAQAQVLSAQGQYQSAQAAFENTVIRAPASGTITSVNIKVGEQASTVNPALVLQDIGNLYLEADVSEANVASIQEGQPVEVTFDALGPDQKYQAHVQSIDPASTVISGVVNYKVTSSLDAVPEIKPGMTANLSILTATKSGVLAISQRAVINKDGKKYVRVVTDPAKKDYKEVEVTTGLTADGGQIEILSGLSEGTEIISFIQE